MSSPLIHEETIDAAVVLSNFPSGGKVFVQTVGAALTLEWYDPKAKVWGDAVAVAEPGATVTCPSNRARITPAAETSIRIVVTA